ncbi:hypothetical protein KX01_303 [Francisella frigiditurris]|uniref:Uncharacterized protein n=1 Tax=Francisella frigiditurris TaxID=1542390 RepID=A0A1J0KR93_9GAMM|nr:hypothetical protein KX01_303 [Francisella frigiditurris]
MEITNKFTRLSKVKFVAEQEIKVDDKVASTNRCEITCVPATGGRPFFPEYLNQFIHEEETNV